MTMSNGDSYDRAPRDKLLADGILPQTKLCPDCNRARPHTDFKLRHRNKPESPYELRPFCIQCDLYRRKHGVSASERKGLGPALAKGLTLSWPDDSKKFISQRLAALLCKNHGEKLDLVLLKLIDESIKTGDSGLLNLLIRTVQGNPIIEHYTGTKKKKVEEVSISTDDRSEPDDLLEKLE